MQTFFAILAVILATGIIIEILYSRRSGKDWYNWKDLLANLNISSGHLVFGLLVTPIVFGGYYKIYELWGNAELRDSISTPVFYILGIVLVDFIVYWNHRLSHTINLFIAGHITHHSSGFYNLSTALRINWIYRGYSWISFIPVALIGYDLTEFILFQTIINLHNGICHTRFNLNFGPLKYIFVTPRYHEIHHCSNEQYRGKNYGGMLIIWDRLFGTFAEDQPEVERKYGIAQNVSTLDPIYANFHFFKELYRDAKAQNISYIRKLFQVGERTARMPDLDFSRSHSLKAFYLIPLSLYVYGVALNSFKNQFGVLENTISAMVFMAIVYLSMKAVRGEKRKEIKIKSYAASSSNGLVLNS